MMNVQDLKFKLTKLRISPNRYSVNDVLPNRYIIGYFNSKWHTYYYDQNENVYAYMDFSTEEEACYNMLEKLTYHSAVMA